MAPLKAKTNPAWHGVVADEPTEITPLEVELNWQGRIYDIVTHTVEVGGVVVRREITLHPGAVSVICLNDDEEVLLLRQYRHAVGANLFEPPAGLMDVPGEPPLAAAKRELAEEAGMVAKQWALLVDFHNSPGGSSEVHRVFLAREVQRLAQGRSGGDGAEENDLAEAWVPLDQAVGLASSGLIANPAAIIGIYATYMARANKWVSLRPADTPWSSRERLGRLGRLPL